MIDPSEVKIVGDWIMVGQEIQADDACNRVEKLVSEYLIYVKDSEASGGWDALFQDPVDGRYWERIFPQSQMQGGGPPSLKVLSLAEVRSKYGVL